MKQSILYHLLAATLFVVAPASAMAGTVTIEGFSPAREHALVRHAEGVAFAGHTGRIEASCNGKPIDLTPADEAKRIPVLDQHLFRTCPGRGLSITITTEPSK